MECSVCKYLVHPPNATVCLGGLGLHLSYHSATAFLGSICLLASQLLSQEIHNITFPAEDQAVTLFNEHLFATVNPCPK